VRKGGGLRRKGEGSGDEERIRMKRKRMLRNRKTSK